MDTVEVIQVIRTTLTRRGDGRNDPIRVITEYWSMDGEKLAEVDPSRCDNCGASTCACNNPITGKVCDHCGRRFAPGEIAIAASSASGTEYFHERCPAAGD